MLDGLIKLREQTDASIRHAIIHRWDVTKAYLIAMAGICFAAVQAVGEPVPYVAPGICALLTLLGFEGQWRWQRAFRREIRQLIKESTLLANHINEFFRLNGIPVGLSLTAACSTKQEQSGYRGIIRVSAAFTFAAVTLLIMFYFQ